MYFTKLTETEFADHALNHEQANFLQSPEMNGLLQKRGFETFYYGIKNDQNQVLLSALIGKKSLKLGYKYFDIDGGFIGDYYDQKLINTFSQGMKELAKQENALYLQIHPNVIYQLRDDQGEITSVANQELIDKLTQAGFTHQGFEVGYSDIYNRFLFVKDLINLDLESLPKTYNQNAKRSIKKAKKFGIKLSQLKYEELSKFKQLMKHTADRCGFHEKTLQYYQILFEEFGDKIKFIVAKINFQEYFNNLANQQEELVVRLQEVEEKLKVDSQVKKLKNEREQINSQIIAGQKRMAEIKNFVEEHGDEEITLAGGVFTIDQHQVVYLWGGLYEQYGNFYAPFLLQNTMIEWALEHGKKRYSFEGISGVFDGSDGVLAFKHNFGGYIEEQPGVFKLICKPMQYRLYQFFHKTAELVR